MRWNFKFSVMVGGRLHLYNLQVVHVNDCCLSLPVVPGREIKISNFSNLCSFLIIFLKTLYMSIKQSSGMNFFFLPFWDVLYLILSEWDLQKTVSCWTTKLCDKPSLVYVQKREKWFVRHFRSCYCDQYIDIRLGPNNIVK